MEAVDRLHAADLPLGSWGFNHYESRAWVSGYAHLDLRAILPARSAMPGVGDDELGSFKRHAEPHEEAHS